LIKKFTQHIKISFIKRELAELIFERKEIDNKENKRSPSLSRMKDISSRVNESNNKLLILNDKL
jgi:hypothetical protein